MSLSSFKILLGFDFGTKRIGVAVGQTVTKTARPLTVIPAKEGTPDWEKLNKIVETWKPDALIVGIPVNMDGSRQLLTQKAQKFSDLLKSHFNLPVFGVDERLTTRDAREEVFNQGGYRALQNRQIDAIAAQLILQTWFMQEENST